MSQQTKFLVFSDLHHGNIDVISQVDVGSTFIIKLPNERKTFDLKEKLSLNRKD